MTSRLTLLPHSLPGAWQTLAPEERFVLAGAAGLLARWPDEDWASLDWERVKSLARQQGVETIIHAALVESDHLHQAPEEVGVWFKRQATEQAGQASRFRYWRRRVLEQLEQAGIPAIVLKGGYLAESIYPAPHLRPMLDLDLLVPVERRLAARSALMNLGYRPVEDHNYGEAHNLALGNHLQMVDPTGRALPVELHWDLVLGSERRVTPDLSRYWWNAQPWTVDGVNAVVLRHEDLLLHLCVHLASADHCFNRLLWFVDLDRLMRHPDVLLDWPYIVQAARADQAITSLYTALRLCRDLLNTPVPDLILLVLAPPGWLRPLVHRLLTPAVVLAGVGTGRQLLLKYLIVDTWRLRARLLRDHLLPSPLLMQARYGLDREPAGWRLVAAYARHAATSTTRGIARLESPVAWPARWRAGRWERPA